MTTDTQPPGAQVRIEVAQQECALKEEHAGGPHGRAASQERKHHLAEHGLDHEEQRGTEENCQRKNQLHHLAISTGSSDDQWSRRGGRYLTPAIASDRHVSAGRSRACEEHRRGRERKIADQRRTLQVPTAPERKTRWEKISTLGKRAPTVLG